MQTNGDVPVQNEDAKPEADSVSKLPPALRKRLAARGILPKVMIPTLFVDLLQHFFCICVLLSHALLCEGLCDSLLCLLP